MTFNLGQNAVEPVLEGVIEVPRLEAPDGFALLAEIAVATFTYALKQTVAYARAKLGI